MSCLSPATICSRLNVSRAQRRAELRVWCRRLADWCEGKRDSPFPPELEPEPAALLPLPPPTDGAEPPLPVSGLGSSLGGGVWSAMTSVSSSQSSVYTHSTVISRHPE